MAECQAANQYEGTGDSSRLVGQAHNDSGVPLWTANLIIATPEGGETVRVKFPAAEAPRFRGPLSPVTVNGLVARQVGDKLYYSAQGIAAVTNRRDSCRSR